MAITFNVPCSENGITGEAAWGSSAGVGDDRLVPATLAMCLAYASHASGPYRYAGVAQQGIR